MGSLIWQAIEAGDQLRADSLFAERAALVGQQSALQLNNERARYLLEFGTADSAVVYAEALAAGSKNFLDSYWLAQCYAKAERLRDAVESLEDATERYDRSRWNNAIHSVEIHFILAKLYEKSGRPDKAAEQYRIFLDLWKDADMELADIKYAKRRLTQLGA